MDDLKKLADALLAYEQCDEDGVRCKVSREACHAAADALASVAAAQRVPEGERAALLCERFAADFTTAPPKNSFEHGVQTATARLAEAFRRAAPPSPAAQQAAEPAWLAKVQQAYGWLWHINNEPMAPATILSPEKAAYEARKRLRDLLTTEQRGVAINAVGREIGKYAEPPTDQARNGGV